MRVLVRQNLGWLVVLGISFISAVIWLTEPGIERFADWRSASLAIAQILGLTGFSMFALNLILSARLHFLEKYFRGLNDIYKKHSLLGQLAFISLLLHPLFLLPVYARSFYSAALFLLPSSDWPRNFGQFALLLLIIIIVLTLYWRPRFDLWKLIHQFMGLAFVLAVLHIYLIPSDVAVYQPLRIYLLGLAMVALLAYSYRTLLGRFLVKRYEYVVTHVSKPAENIIAITLEPIRPAQGKPLAEKLNFTPGQFAFIRVLGRIIGEEEHPFSFTSNPKSKELSFAIKQVGDYTRKLDKLQPGLKVKLEGPFGIFSYSRAEQKNQIWVAGGIGITPFLSMLQAIRQETGYRVDFYYCVKNRQEAAFLGTIENFAPEVQVIPFYSDAQGFITANTIEKLSGGLADKEIFLCAPLGMMKALRKQLVEKGVENELIHSEEFEL